MALRSDPARYRAYIKAAIIDNVGRDILALGRRRPALLRVLLCSTTLPAQVVSLKKLRTSERCPERGHHRALPWPSIGCVPGGGA